MNLKENILHTLRLRLLFYLLILVAILLMGLLIAIFTTGNKTAGLRESENFIKNEYSDISAHITEYYGKLAAEAVSFSKIVSIDIENRLKANGFNINDIKVNPELLEDLIENEVYQVLLYLNKSKSSGAFVILDATVNNRLPDSDISKAGFYLKNMEPNIVNSTSPTIYVLRGNPHIAYKNSLPLHPEWKMEFNIDDALYYNEPIKNALHNKGTLSNMYYWSPAFVMPDTSEEIMMCTVPLIDSEGNVFGVCGLDVSAMLFKLSFMPDNSIYHKIFCMLSPNTNNTIKTNESLISAGYTAIKSISTEDLLIQDGKKLNTYTSKLNKVRYIGYHEIIKMYPEDSVFSNNKWALSLMVPQDDVKSFVVKAHIKVFATCSFFMILGLIASLVLSKFYIKPIHTAINNIKNNPDLDVKTNFIEIDELIEYISAKEDVSDKNKESNYDSEILNEFLKNLKTLSPAERSVFNLYSEDYSAKEIADTLCLSINTIKTHTKHIYSKLYIKSREELLLYVEMLKETGKY